MGEKRYTSFHESWDGLKYTIYHRVHGSREDMLSVGSRSVAFASLVDNDLISYLYTSYN